MASSSSNKSGKANTFLWSFLEQGGSKAIQLFVQIILARLLSPEAFGILAILLVVTQITDSIAQSGLGMALIQKSDADDRSYSTAWWLSLGLAAALYIVVYFTSPTISVFYNMPDLVVYLRVLGVIVFFNSANSIQRSYLQRNMNFRCIFAATTIAALISGFGGVVLAFFGFGVWSLVLQSLLQSIFICIVMWLQISWKPAFTFDVAQAWSLFSYGWKICITGILNVIYSGISELIIGRACSTSELGLYSQGRKYPTAAVGVMSNSIANVLLPMFSAIKGDSEALRGAIRRGLTLGTFLVAPISLLAAVVAKPLVAILLTEKWLACVPIFQLTCISNAILMIQLVNLRAYMALGDSSLYMRLQIIKVLGGGAIIWITAALTHDIYHTAWANFIVGVISIVFVDATPAKRLHGYSSFNQVKDVLPILFLSLSLPLRHRSLFSFWGWATFPNCFCRASFSLLSTWEEQSSSSSVSYPRQHHSCAGLFQGEAEVQLFIRLLINSNTIERYQSNVDIQRVNFNDYGRNGILRQYRPQAFPDLRCGGNSYFLPRREEAG